MLMRTGSESILTLVSSDSPSSEVRQELVEISEYSEGTALIGLGGFLGEVWAEKELEIKIGPQNQYHFGKKAHIIFKLGPRINFNLEKRAPELLSNI